MSTYSVRLRICMLIATIVPAAASAAVLSVREGQSIQAAVRQAAPGDTIEVEPGTYRESVYIDKDGITLRGHHRDGAWPTLDGEDRLNDGVMFSGHHITVEGLKIRRYRGNGVFAQGGNDYVIRHNVIEQVRIYSIFPQYNKNGLIDGNICSDSRDAAIYVGMNENTDVVNNEVFNSVIGVEFENNGYGLAQGNYLHDNSVGVMISSLPGLPVMQSTHVIVRNNTLVNNNHVNFAPPRSPASSVPQGLGILVLAGDHHTIEGNLIKDNEAAGIMVVDANFIGIAWDPRLEVRPEFLRFGTNVFYNNGAAPHEPMVSLLHAAGAHGSVDVFDTGKGRKNCMMAIETVAFVGGRGWSECETPVSTASLTTYRTAKTQDIRPITVEEKAKLAFMAICTGCHVYSSRLVGPSVQVIQAIYENHPEKLAEYIAHPTKKRPDYEEMPRQDYLPEDVRLALAKHVLALRE